MIIRRERVADTAASRAACAEAFAKGDDEAVEASLLDALRTCDGWIPALSLVAEVDGQIVGHNVCTRAFIGDVPCVGLGPISVAAATQSKGVGSALMHAMIGSADASGEPLIGLLGNPDYYSRFGFAPSSDFGIQPPEAAWGKFFQVLRLDAWTEDIKGEFRYSEPFQSL